MKYIIDIPDNAGWIEYYAPVEEVSNRFKGTAVGIDRLEPYTEPDRKAIEDEVWKFAKKVRLEGFDSYQEAKAKYVEWKKQKDEIHVGDEVEDADGFKGIALDELLQDSLHILDEDGELRLVFPKHLHKTGRHFDEVETMLKKMKEES